MITPSRTTWNSDSECQSSRILGLVLIWILHEIKNTNLAGPHRNQSSKSVQIHPNLSTVYYPNTFSISTEAMLKLLTDEFSKNNPEDGRYTPQQHRQDSESSPATTGEFNCMLNAAVNKVHQPQADKVHMWDAELHKSNWVRVCQHSVSMSRLSQSHHRWWIMTMHVLSGGRKSSTTI